MAQALLEATLGAVSPYVAIHAVIEGQSIANFGDLANIAGTNFDFVSNHSGVIGWDHVGASDLRVFVLYNIDLSTLEAKAKLGRVLFHPYVVKRTGSSPGDVVFSCHEIEGTIGAGSTWLLRQTAVTWYGGGYGPKPGYDYNSTPEDTDTLTAAEWASLSNANYTVRLPLEFDITEAAQRARDERRNLPLLLVTSYTNPNAGSDNFIDIDYAADFNFNASLHTVVDIDYWPAIGVHGSLPDETGRPFNPNNLHDRNLAGTSNRSYLGTVEQGTTGDEYKWWAVNHRTEGPRKNVCVGTSRSEATGVDNSGSVSGLLLKNADVYDTLTTSSPQEATPSGDFVITPASATTYGVVFTDTSGVATTLAEQTTGFTTVSMSADHVFLYSSKKALKIKANAWKDATGTTVVTTGLSTSDRFRFSTRGDLRTTESVDTLAMARVMPPTSRHFGDTPDTTRARPLKNAFTQQCWAPAVDVNIAGTIRTHLKIRNGDTAWNATAIDAWVDIFIPSTNEIISAQIGTVYGSADATYPDQLRLTTQLSGVDLAKISAATWVTGGIALGDLARMQYRRLAAVGTAGTSSIVLDSALSDSPGMVDIVSAGVGEQRVAVVSGTLTLALAAPLDFTFPEDDTFVYVVVDATTDPTDMFSKPFFENAKVPSAQVEGLYSGFYDVFEVKIV